MRPPSGGEFRSRYGWRVNPVTRVFEKHHGLDIGDEAGEVLVAPEPCTFIGYGTVKGWAVHGRVARLRGQSGYEHWLSHTDRALAAVGDELLEGAPVAVMGLTGQTTGLHVHWETRKDGQRLDPEAWLATAASLAAEPLEDDMPFTDDDRKMLADLVGLAPTLHQISRRLETVQDAVERIEGLGPTIHQINRRIVTDIDEGRETQEVAKQIAARADE